MFGRRADDRAPKDQDSDGSMSASDQHADDSDAHDAVEGADMGDPHAVRALVDALAAEREEFKDKWLRAMAEYQNYQRRALQNEIEAKRQGITGVLMSIVPVLDAFDMASSSAGGDAHASAATLEGVRVIHQTLLTALSAHGVSVIHPQPNDEFDPNLHSGIMERAVEGVEPGRVSMCVQVGYQLGDRAGDRVIRSAKVAIAPAA